MKAKNSRKTSIQLLKIVLQTNPSFTSPSKAKKTTMSTTFVFPALSADDFLSWEEYSEKWDEAEAEARARAGAGSAPSVLKVSIKRADGTRGEPRYDTEFVKRDKSLYIGRCSAMMDLKGKKYSPARKLSAFLTSNGPHAMIEFIRSDARPGVFQDGFYLFIFPKNDGSAPTNPLWKFNEISEEWEQQEFSTDPILLQPGDRYCIGGQFYFKIGSPTKGYWLAPGVFVPSDWNPRNDAPLDKYCPPEARK